MNSQHPITLELRNKMLQRQGELEKRVKNLKKDITKKNSADWSEQAQERSNDDVLKTLDIEAQTEINQIQKALNRMDSDEYAVCQKCGCDIPLERLNIMPYTEFCVKCASKLDL